MIDQSARLAIQQLILAAPRLYGDLLRTVRVVECGGVQSGATNDDPRFDHAARRIDSPEAVHALKALDCGVQAEFHAVFAGVFRQRFAELKRAHDAARGRMQRGGHLGGERRLQPPRRVAGNDLKPGHTVGCAALQQLAQHRLVRFVKGDHQRTVAPEGNVQLGAQLIHHGVALHVKARLQTARLGVESGVHDGAVGLAGARAHVLLALQHAHGQPIARQRPRCGAAHCARADYGYIIHVLYPPF